jgi:hypothetical protein
MRDINKTLINKNPYHSLGKFVLRTPAFSIREKFEYLLQSSYFQEAIYIASPSLYKECARKGFIISKLDENELKALYKYYIRSTTRCIPFGLFFDVR